MKVLSTWFDKQICNVKTWQFLVFLNTKTGGLTHLLTLSCEIPWLQQQNVLIAKDWDPLSGVCGHLWGDERWDGTWDGVLRPGNPPSVASA